MSRSQPEAVATTNPAKYVLEWAGDSDSGYFRYYDKDLKDTECKGRVKIDSLQFAYLDDRSAVLGWSQKHKSSLYSNEVKFMNENIVLLTWDRDAEKSKVLLEGVYKDIKGDAVEMGARYHKIVYAMVTQCSDPNFEAGTVVRLKLKGASVKAWGDVKSPTAGAINVGFEEGKNGAVKYRYPTFTMVPLDRDLEELAYKKDEELQRFFEARAAENEKREEKQEPVAQTVPSDEEPDDLPF